MESPDQSYAAITDVISMRGARDYVVRDRIELFKRMVFNILVTNNDDHLRNHAFLHDGGARGWRLSPLYDVVLSPVVGTERFLNVGVELQGRAARPDNALSGAGRFGIQRRAAARLIEALVEQVRTWRNTFDACGVSEETAMPWPGRSRERVTHRVRRGGTREAGLSAEASG